MTLRVNYQARRQALARSLPSNGVAIIPGASEIIRNGDAHYTFRQHSDFYYLTGFDEPDALLLIFSGDVGESVLFNQPLDPMQEQWTGPRLGQELACQQLQVAAAYSTSCLDERLPELLAGQQTIYYTLGRDEAWDRRIQQAYQRVRCQRNIIVPEVFWDLTPFLSELRLFKDANEVALMREAARISILAHQRTMRMCGSVKYEYELEAEIIYELNRHGCRNVAYNSIVASGKNACVLHYTKNDQRLRHGDLVLIDAGGEYQNYAADITRTYPINGVFSTEQALIYDLVLQSQKAGIKCLQPGREWLDIQQAIVLVLTQGLVDLKILKGNVDDLVEQAAYKPFYMHNSGHWLGLDVHDVGRYQENGKSRILQPGMAFTIEPGLYLSENIVDLDPKWWNIGVRIEDDFVLTKDGFEHLTAGLIVEKHDVETYLRS